ncbi:hypothetical protein N7495_004735 [Penicillium taxi]|uniref:uncharacterized protein n=1 Tax=Penicillium taxi TaxID=168475 RepID=UPI002544D68A|nr:uncharacterized protein N7495_004735 [Penicillium taxi]KAJ5899991.1 hypothetical protein N7495_004735 [Penicillium taxi]
MCFALFTIFLWQDTFVYGMVVPILPSLLMENGSIKKDSVQQWISLLLASYGGALLIGSPVVGYLCDKYRARKAPLIFGFIAIVLATLLFIFSRQPMLLLVARVCQGLSGAVVGVLGLSMIAETATPEHLPAYMAFGSASLTWGMFCGPMAGGVLFAKFGTAGAFGFPIALLIVDIILRLLILEEDQDVSTDAESCFESDYPQEAAPLLKGDIPGGDSLRLSYFMNTTFLGLMLSVLVISSVLSAYESVNPAPQFIPTQLTEMQTLPLYVMKTYHWTSIGAGFVFLPVTIPSFLSISVVHYTRHFKPRNIVLTGFLLMVVPTIALRWTHTNTIKHEVILVCLLFVIGMCMTTVQAITMGDVPHAVQKITDLHGISDESSGQGRAYAFCNMAFAAGQAVGPVLGGLAKHKLGWGFMTMLLAFLCLIAGILSYFSTSATPANSQANSQTNEDPY